MLSISFARVLKTCRSLPIMNRNHFFQRYTYSTKNKCSELFVEKNTLGEIGTKYQVFQDKDADIILDVYEEKLKYQHLLEENEEEVNPLNGLNLESKYFLK